ncbi:putative ABC transport system permease protein [Catalinimonas alkaloidigena]|uniref:ABC transporter permease n=1 Tax=Catalinimonas alkaloidigena TaxID=1075417 RepID=UPI002405768E|nr:ABC transporter permease [Catalinimonas alkaloidigena]MDF9797105.1 putative ABC transport system permease protein [Catalinimonas alkaloidigena]
MIKNYLSVASRNLLKQKFYTLINVLGLSIGLATCLLISAYLLDELSYDQHHLKADRIYRIHGYYKMGGQEGSYAVVPAPFAQTVNDNYPEVVSAVRFRQRGGTNLYNGNQVYQENKVVYVDSTVFKVFNIPMLYGNPETALTEPNHLVISTDNALKYFGADWEKNPPIGKNIQVGREKVEYTISGVFETMPSNSHFHFDVMFSMASLEESRNDMWLSNNFHTYLLLREDANPQQLEAKLNETFKTYAAPQLKQFANISMDEFMEAGNTFKYTLHPLLDIHLYSNLRVEMEANGDIKYVYIFAAIAFFVLLIACVNFMNLSTARSAGRAKEVGIRKTLGSQRKQLIFQFLVEAMLLTAISMVIALLLAEVMLPYFNDLSAKQLKFTNFNWEWVALAIICTIFTVGLMAGSYPAFILSSFRPIEVLKGKISKGVGNTWLRGGLVVFQFGVSIILIVGTIVVYQQLEFIRDMKLGYDKEHVLVLHNTFYLGEQIDAFKQEMLRNPNIVNATISSFLPANSISNNSNAIFRDKNPNDEHTTSVPWWSIDYDYIETMGMHIVEGRNFSREYSTDSMGIIVNESFVRQFELNNDGEGALGKLLSSFGEQPDKIYSFHVLGVVQDFHYQTMREKISPMVMVIGSDKHQMGKSTAAISFRIKPENIKESIAFLESEWKKYVPELPFEYSFMDERFDNLYQTDQKIGKIFTIFCGLALFIACLGLFGLASFTAEQKTKEIGIRKVLGASESQLVYMFSKDFTRLVLISFVIAVPLSYLAMNMWLQDFAYHINLGLGIFLFAGIIALVIAWLTVSFQSIRAAHANPAETLRTE